ncbi:phage protein [Enterocloster lavalensis]|uniref:phage protein n=1 Tax=Enterocloster lavalensis TaxID=460384 RepID=UPI0026650B8D|nr:DUF3597 family protein [Enterocloster lavalensis]
MKRSFVVDGHGHGRDSRVIEALRRLEGEISLETEAADTGGLYSHTVIIQTGDVTIDNEELDCEFDIPFDDDTEANEAEIIVYNLSDLTIQNIKKDNPITVTAGYGDDTGIIFSGLISKARSYYSDEDRVTEIHAIDQANLKERDLQNISYAGGTPASRILQDLVGMVGLPVAVFSLKRDHVYKDKATIDGGLMENICKYAGVCGVSAYICKGQIYVRHIQDGDGLDFALSADTGLLSLSEFEEEQTAEDFKDTVHGYEITMLLQHRVTTASLINLQARNVSGAFRVREGSHSYDGTDFLTKVKAIECPPAPAAEAAAESAAPSLPDLSGYSGVSIVDGLKSVGADSSYTYRKILAEQLGIQGYSGSAAQNLEMLRKLGAKVG